MNLKNTLKLSTAMAFMALLSVSCGDRKAAEMIVDSDAFAQIDVTISPGQPQYFSDLIEDIRFIPLETTDKALVGDIDKITYYDSDYYILDTERAAKIFRFDSDGKFLNSIGLKGRGPGEYISPEDFVVNSSGVTVLDHYGQKLVFFDHEGNFKKDVPLGFILYEITRMDENLIFAVAGDNSNLEELKGYEYIIIDTVGNVVSKGLYDNYNMNYRSGFKSFSYDDSYILKAFAG